MKDYQYITCVFFYALNSNCDLQEQQECTIREVISSDKFHNNIKGK
jgi:hypothetical protein